MPVIFVKRNETEGGDQIMRRKQSLANDWYFTLRDITESEPERKKEGTVISLPHCWNIDDPSQTGMAVYQKEIEIDLNENECVYLDVGAASGVCKAWLNGMYLGEHRGSYARFRFDLSKAVKQGTNRLCIVSDNTRYPDLNPLIGDFNIYGGLYRDVNLLTVNKAHFDPMHYGSDGIEIETEADGTIRIHAKTVNANNASFRYEIIGEETETFTFDCADACIQIQNPHLWNGKKDPYLYQLKAVLLENGEESDCVVKTFGFRDFRIDPQEGAFLNGEHIKLKGVAKHQDFAGYGNAVTGDVMEMDMAIINEMGANAVRLSHYQHADEIYDICDRLGILVWAEIPMLSLPKDNHDVLENAKIMMQELIAQNRHHPCIFCWGIQNEVTMTGEYEELYPKMRELNDLVHSLDHSRLSASANIGFVKNESPLNRITDILGYNLYSGWYYGTMHDYTEWFQTFHKDNPDLCIAMTEYGVESSPFFHSSDPHVKDYTEEYQTLYHAAVWPQVEKEKYVWGSFVWNMFDFGSAIRNEGGCKGLNRKGLVTFDRKIRKDAYYVYKAMWSDESFVHICSKRYEKRCEDETVIMAASNLKDVRVTVNGKECEMIQAGPLYRFRAQLDQGENEVIAYSGTYQDSCTITRCTEPEPSYTFVDENPEFNPANWFVNEDGQGDFMKNMYSVNDTMDDLLANEEVKALLNQEVPEIINDERNKDGNGMELIRIFNYMRTKYTEDFVRELNAKLNRIHK